MGNKVYKNYLLFVPFYLFFILFPFSVHAQSTAPNSQRLGKISGLGPLGTIIDKITAPSDIAPASNKFALLISNIIGIITIVAGIWFLIQILIAGFNIVTGSGDKNKVQEAQHKITNSVIGLTVVVAAYALTSLFGKILGIPYILNIGTSIKFLQLR